MFLKFGPTIKSWFYSSWTKNSRMIP